MNDGILAWPPMSLQNLLSTDSEQEGSTSAFSLLDAFLRTSPDVIVVHDPAGRYVYVNSAAESLTGIPRDALLGKTVFEIGISEETARHLNTNREQVVQTGQVYQGANLLPTAQGARFYQSTISPITNAQGVLVATLSVARDITEQRRTEEERRYVMNGARCLLWFADVYDGGEKYLDWHLHIPDKEAALRFIPLDIREGETFDQAWYRCRLPEDRDRCDHIGTTSIRSGQSYQQEFRCLCVDGSVRWLHEDVNVEVVTPEKHYRIVTVCTEITQRKLVEEALQQSEQQLRTALAAGEMGIWEADLIEEVITWSPEALRLIGQENGSLKTELGTYDQFIHPEDLESFRQSARRAIDQRLAYEHEYRIVKPGGGVRWVQAKGTIFYEDSGRAVRMLGTIADVTEHKRLEEQLLLAQKMDGIGRLAGGIAHDFNNLLSVILGYAEMVEMEIAAESDLLPKVQNIHHAATRAAKLTSQLLAFARRQVSITQVIRANDLLARLHDLLGPLIREDIELTMRLDEQAGSIKVDPTQIEQILVNLVVNAVDAMPHGGKILIETANVMLADHYLREQTTVRPGEYVLLAISDTGTGMTEEVKKHLFEPFFTTKGIGKGTGLGLATVYGIVKQNEGYLLAYSELGIGTTMKVYLPRVDAPKETASSKGEKTESLVGQETILVVEDEPLVRQLTVSTLTRSGYHVLQAENGIEALKRAADYAGEIHLVVTDAIMPQMGGKELSEKLRLVRPSSRVLYVSGYTEEITSSQGILPKGIAFLQKPFTSKGLLAAVRGILDSA